LFARIAIFYKQEVNWFTTILPKLNK